MADPHSTPHHRHRAWFSAAALVVACASLVARAEPADAGDGSTGYEGVFSSTAPSNYAPAPAAHPPSTTVRYSFTVSNTAVVPATFTASLYAQRLTSVRGTDVSSGDPAFSERDVLTGPASGDSVVLIAPVPGSSAVFLPGETDAVDMMVTTAGCGYLLIWAGSSADRSPGTVLNDGVTRVTGCSVATASPPQAPSPSADPAATPGAPAAPAAPAHASPRPSSTSKASASPSPSSAPTAAAVPPYSPGSASGGTGVPRQPLTGGVVADNVDQSNPFPIRSGLGLSGIKAQRAVVVGAVLAAGIVLSLLVWLRALRRRSRDARRSGKAGGPPAPGVRATHRG